MSDLKVLSDNFASLDKKVKEINKDLASKEARCANLQADIKDLNSQKEVLNGQVNNLKKVVAEAVDNATKTAYAKVKELQAEAEAALAEAQKQKGIESEKRKIAEHLTEELAQKIRNNEKALAKIQNQREEIEVIKQDFHAIVKIIKDILDK